MNMHNVRIDATLYSQHWMAEPVIHSSNNGEIVHARSWFMHFRELVCKATIYTGEQALESWIPLLSVASITHCTASGSVTIVLPMELINESFSYLCHIRLPSNSLVTCTVLFTRT